ncbi:MAG: CAP domain-containing protein [Sulfobacillus benefaciens]|uniref:CAP domain-containing protein n=1 Tax=Sulfobacillus benefaciens TaxID=453960 RepID=A0A2T2WSW9_9FIRM|nr:MAG: CAP domain-containing protein [Sulfobacillus benefaciens]
MNYFTALLVAAGLPVTAGLSTAPTTTAIPVAVTARVSPNPAPNLVPVASVQAAYQTMAAQAQTPALPNSTIAWLSSASASSPLNPAEQMIELINQVRQEKGLAPYTINPVLMQLAQERAVALANGPFTSDMAQYGWPIQMEMAAGLQAQGMGAENIAEASSVQEAFTLLMASPPHAENILNPSETQIGVGVAPWGSGVAISELFMGPNT